MGAVPKRKPSTRRQGKRRAGHKIKRPSLVPCPSCQELRPPHHACPHCGHYKKKAVVEIKTKEEKKT